MVFAKRAVAVTAMCLAAALTALTASPERAEACGVSAAEAAATRAVENALPGVVVRSAVTTDEDAKRATVRIRGGKDGKNVDLVAKLVNGESGWRVVSLSPRSIRRLKSPNA